MARIGLNPARIIPVWREFVEEHSDNVRGTRGIGEPIWVSRSPDELVECERHEALLNLAFASPAGALHLVCPFDAETLPTSVIEEAWRNHPIVTEGGDPRRSATYRRVDAVARPFEAELAGRSSDSHACARAPGTRADNDEPGPGVDPAHRPRASSSWRP
jgi:hypothetical protein